MKGHNQNSAPPPLLHLFILGNITLPEDKPMALPGENVTMRVDLITDVAMEKGLRFVIREGNRTIGTGVVAEIHD